MNQHLKVALASLALLCCLPAHALPTDSQQPMNLSHESADLRRGQMVYQGNVKLTQGSLRIESDELVIHRSGDVVERVVATGSPAIFEQQPEVDQAPIVVEGKRIEYELQAGVERVAVMDGARMEQGGIVSRCERIEFNLTESTAKMMGSCVTERPAQSGGSNDASGTGS